MLTDRNRYKIYEHTKHASEFSVNKAPFKFSLSLKSTYLSIFIKTLFFKNVLLSKQTNNRPTRFSLSIK